MRISNSEISERSRTLKPMSFIDTHCHLNFIAFENDYLSVFERAIKVGLEKIVIPGSDLKTSTRAVEIAREINANCGKNVAFAAVSIHPVHAGQSKDFGKIVPLAQEKEVVAIGETGLDKYHSTDLVEQVELFKKHLELAIMNEKPIIFHNRDADEEVLSVLNEMPRLPRGVFHCFSSDHNFAKKVLDRGFFISFTGNITYGNKRLKKVIERTPLEKIMIETDSPYIVPEPFRSNGIKRNEPQHAIEVAKKIAAIKNIELEKVLSQTTQNASSFFAI